ncbi:MAG: PHP-associated domain-containing protein [Dehalococcoidia bacterium]|nr:PHP-associated domain-containing protein [Dehalococcoidia bacterium]
MIVDLHVHTSWGGYDSALSPREAIEEAKKINLDGICLTEHNTSWDRLKLDELGNGSGLALLRGIEVDTELGHILAYGFDRYVAGIYRSADLRQEADKVGGFLVAAHPFRRLFGSPGYAWGGFGEGKFTLEEAIKQPIFQVTDEIEVLNGGCTTRENMCSFQVARALGKKGVGGSDAHSNRGLGKFTTVLESRVTSDHELVEELRAGRFYPASRQPNGDLLPYAGLDQEQAGNL